ncbi:sensor domain-containing diguanylate cyclase [Marinomonas atlantica]|uniref:sensor domain-containing diguanylate cyclase n=1 Tax=Marinomonas atlantica TaxID=1806668 RepID=UPI0009ED9274|nr:sensor domain-containing diguanylate cyclase [Marinomonas atlantica]
MSHASQNEARPSIQPPNHPALHWFNSFRNRIAVLFGCLLLMLGIIVVTYIYQASSSRLTNASGKSLAIIAQSVANTLALTLKEREREIILLSKRPLFATERNQEKMQAALDRTKDSYQHYAWIGFANADGKVMVAGKKMLQGADVSQRPWFVLGSQGPFVGDVHEALLLASMIEPMDDGSLPRFVDFAAPVYGENGTFEGVIAAHSNWDWVRGVLNSALPNEHDNIEIFIVDKHKEVLYPNALTHSTEVPNNIPAPGEFQYNEWNDGKRYLTTLALVNSSISTDLGWKIIVRQPSDVALSTVYNMRVVILLISIAATLIGVFIAYQLAGALSRPIERLAATALRIKNGDRKMSFTETDSHLKEVISLSNSLQGMMTSLLDREQSLVEMNANLEAKVQKRTNALEQVNKELAELALRDPLTQCFNRLALEEAMSQIFAQAADDGDAYSVIMIDIDHFKAVNDTYGHQAGDEALKKLVELMHDNTRDGDFVARYGGEEFTILLPKTDTKTAAERAEQIRKIVEQTEIEEIGHITISLGVATYQQSDERAEIILDRSDEALYQSKENGRNQVSVN